MKQEDRDVSNGKAGREELKGIVLGILIFVAILLAVLAAVFCVSRVGCPVSDGFRTGASAMRGASDCATQSASDRKQAATSWERTRFECKFETSDINRAELDNKDLDDDDGRGRSRSVGK